jgi:hypothetical protein
MAMLVVLGRLLAENPAETCDVFLIGDLQAQNRSLRKQSINQVFSGKSPNTPDRALLKYCGDRDLHTETRISLHLRYFQFIKSAIPESDASLDVPWFALHIPDNLKKRVLIQSDA